MQHTQGKILPEERWLKTRVNMCCCSLFYRCLVLHARDTLHTAAVAHLAECDTASQGVTEGTRHRFVGDRLNPRLRGSGYQGCTKRRDDQLRPEMLQQWGCQ